MPRDASYISPLLSVVAADYSAIARKDFIAPLLFPYHPVDKATNKYKCFNKDDAFTYPDATLGPNGEAKTYSQGGKMEPINTKTYALKDSIDVAENEKADEAFKTSDADLVEQLVYGLEANHEIRCAEKVKKLSADHSKTLSGAGTEKENIWLVNGDSTGGDPYIAIEEAIQKLIIPPNIIIIPQTVFNVLKNHPVLIAKLGEANMIKKVNEETLSILFDIEKVVVARAQYNTQKKKTDGSVNLSQIWGDMVILAYVSNKKNVPCAGKTFYVQYTDANNEGYIVRKYFDDDSGAKGAEYSRVAQDLDETLICKECIYVIKDCLKKTS